MTMTPLARDKGALSYILASTTPTSRGSHHRAFFSHGDDTHRTTDAPRVGRFSIHALLSQSSPRQRLQPPQRASVADQAVKKSSKYCMVDGCTSRAKHARRCWKHGGSVQCKVPDCANRAKSKGVCWSHGGGSPCSVADCETIAVSNGFCWAHGGGKRCRERGCSRPAYERTRNLCAQHFHQRAPPPAL